MLPYFSVVYLEYTREGKPRNVSEACEQARSSGSFGVRQQ
jgi:hypothetical protein